MEIRFAQNEDIEELVRISYECFSEPFTEENFKSTFNNEAEAILVAEESGRLLGYCDFTMAGPEGELLQIAVLSDSRNKGTGRLLFSKMLSLLRENSVLQLFLEVRKGNISAQKLYESFGMEKVGKRPGFYNFPKEDALIYRLDI